MNMLDVIGWTFVAIVLASTILDALFIYEARRHMRSIRLDEKTRHESR